MSKKRPPKPCPACDQPPASCTCDLEDRWIPLDGLWIHLTADGYVDVRIFEHMVTTGDHITEATPTILAWGERLYRDRLARGDTFGDLPAEIAARKAKESKESWGDLARGMNRRLASYLARVKADELTPSATREFSILPEGIIWQESLTLKAARAFIRDDLHKLGVGKDRAQEIVTELVNAVQRGEDPFKKKLSNFCWQD